MSSFDPLLIFKYPLVLPKEQQQYIDKSFQNRYSTVYTGSALRAGAKNETIYFIYRSNHNNDDQK